MNQSERRRYLIQELIKENTQYNNLEIPQNKEEQKQLLRSLMNIRFACPISDEFKQILDHYVQIDQYINEFYSEINTHLRRNPA